MPRKEGAVVSDEDFLAWMTAVDVLLNNAGGGIFHFLPIARHAGLLDPWFTAPHDVDFGAIERLAGIRCHRPESAAAFTAVYREACASGAPARWRCGRCSMMSCR